MHVLGHLVSYLFSFDCKQSTLWIIKLSIERCQDKDGVYIFSVAQH